jgi:RNA polymerase sigma factor (TIGR02999 family)
LADSGEVTRLLADWAEGDEAALNSLAPIVYSELRKIADGYLRQERSSHTLQPTALVHEAWLRLVRQDRPSLQNRQHFFGLAAQIMRRILVDHARAVQSEKRGGGATRVDLFPEMGDYASPNADEFLALDQALTRLSAMSPRKAQVIELRYFGGLEIQETSEIMGISPSTVTREQRTAEAWLSHAMSITGNPGSTGDDQ